MVNYNQFDWIKHRKAILPVIERHLKAGKSIDSLFDRNSPNFPQFAMEVLSVTYRQPKQKHDNKLWHQFWEGKPGSSHQLGFIAAKPEFVKGEFLMLFGVFCFLYAITG